MMIQVIRFSIILTIFSFMPIQKSFAEEKGDPKRGPQLFSLCQSCHGMKGEGRKDLEAPAIAGMQDWYVLNQLKGFRNGARGQHHLDMPGMRMRPMAKTLRDSDLEVMATYVSKLPVQPNKTTLSGGNILNGKKLFGTCSACHGANGAGMKAVNAQGEKSENHNEDEFCSIPEYDVMT